jgi:hypothetical protein
MYGQDEKNPMIERIADDLLPAVESVAIEEINSHGAASDSWETAYYLPLIVTSAPLYLAWFDPASVHPETGKLDLGQCDFRQEPYVRFRKGLATHRATRLDIGGISPHRDITRQINELRQRTVFVVSANALPNSYQIYT